MTLPPNVQPPGPGQTSTPRALPLALRSVPPHVTQQHLVDQHIDPGNALQVELMHRIAALTPGEAQTLNAGITPKAVAVFRRLFPELSFLLDQIVNSQLPQPTTRLGSV